jgi:HK97 gp10 family phage protein
MSSDLTRFKGGRELAAFLDALPKRLAKGALRSALRAGANVVRDEARRIVPVHEGRLRASLKVGTRAGADGMVSATVRTRMFYARFVEFGTAAHEIAAEKGGSLFIGGIFRELVKHPGAKAKPFMRPAIDAKAAEAVRAVGNQLQKRLNKQGLNAGSLEIDEGDEP